MYWRPVSEGKRSLDGTRPNNCDVSKLGASKVMREMTEFNKAIAAETEDKKGNLVLKL
jgi:hypothetical protein